jgi:hypothetical protein
MDHTLEVRWFFSGRVPASVTDWAEDLGARPESTRTDRYLISDDPGLNVKVREGKLQTKRRLWADGPLAFTPSVEGREERWTKWSFSLDEARPDLVETDPTGLWQPVHKERLRIEVGPGEQAGLLDTLEEPDPAEAKLELTRVRSGTRHAWTICMESEGRPQALPGTLRQVGRHLFRQDGAPALRPEQSKGYVAWLRDTVATAPS